MSRATTDWRGGAFTLVELMVVVAILAMLMAILLPSLRQARLRAQETVCGVDQRSLGQILIVAAAENRGLMPDLSLRPGTASTRSSNIYWSWAEWRKTLEAQYGRTLRNLVFSVCNPYWSSDRLYYWDTSDPDTATYMVMGRCYYATSLANSDTFYNNMLNPPASSVRPLFPVRLSTRSWSPMILSDLTRQNPESPGYIEWGNGNGVGANHLYGTSREEAAGTHITNLDGSTYWKDWNDMAHMATHGSTELYW